MANRNLSMDLPEAPSPLPLDLISGTLEQKSEEDKVHERPPSLSQHEQRPRTFRVSLVVSWSLWLAYTIFEVILIRRAEKRNGRFIWRLWAIAFAEVALALPQFFFSMNTFFVSVQPRARGGRPKYELREGVAPLIDVFLLTCGEPTYLVMDTLLAVSLSFFLLHEQASPRFLRKN